MQIINTDRFSENVEITVRKNCPVKKNGKTIGRVIDVRQTNGEVVVDFDLDEQDILEMFAVCVKAHQTKEND